jgi:hypothetical protein
MYKLTKPIPPNTDTFCVLRTADGACIPFDPANTDYQRFKKDVNEGAELQDAEGNAMTEQQTKDFVKELS